MATLVGSLATAGGADFFNAGDCAASPYVCATTGTVDTMSMVITASGYATLRLGIWADSAGAPAALLGQTVTTTTTAAGTLNLAMVSNLAVTSGITYWLGALGLGGAGILHCKDGLGSYKGNSGNAALPNPFGTVTFSDASNSMPIAGTGTAGGGGGSTVKQLAALGVG